MKNIYYIMTSILLFSLSPNLHSTDKSNPTSKSVLHNNTDNNLLSDSSNQSTEQTPPGKGMVKEKGRNEQTKQSAGKLELVIQNGHSAAVNGILLTKDEKKMISYSADGTIKIWDVEQGKLLKTLEGHSLDVKGVRLTKDENKLISYSDDKTIKIWDMENKQVLKTLYGNTSVTQILLTKDEKKLISCSSGNSIKIWDIEEGKLLTLINTDVLEIRLIKDEKKLISFHRNNTIQIWDIISGKILMSLNEHSSWVDGVEFTKDGKKLVSYSKDKSIMIWDMESGTILKTLQGHTNIIKGIQFTKDEGKLISYSADGTIKIWDMNEGKLIQTFKGHVHNVEGIQLFNEEKELLSYSFDGTIKAWDLKNGKLLNTLEGHIKGVSGIHLTKDEKRLISYSYDSTVKIWDMKERTLIQTFKGDTQDIKGIQLLKEEKELISYSKDGTIKIWNMSDLKLSKSFEKSHIEKSYRTQFISNNTELILDSSENDKVNIWNLDNGKIKSRMQGFSLKRLSMQLSKNEKQLIFDFYTEFPVQNKTIEIFDIDSGNLQKTVFGGMKNQFSEDEKKLISYDYENNYNITILDIDSEKILNTFKGHTNRVWKIQITRDEKKLISCSWDSTIKIWNIETGKIIRTIEGHSGFVLGIQLTKDESRLISYSNDNTIKIWESNTGKLFKTLEGHTGIINGIQFSKDEGKLISYSSDKTIKVWDIESGKLLNSLEGHTDNIIRIQLIDDDKTIISTSSDNTIKIWDISDLGTGDENVRTHGRASLRLTLDHKSSPIINYTIKKTPSGQFLISISSDGSIRYWDISETKTVRGSHDLPLQPRLTQLLFKNGHSIYYTPEGYFDYTDKSVLDYISFVSPNIQNSFVDLQDLMNGYHVDGLLELVTENKFKPNRRNSLTRGVKTAAAVKALFETQQSVVSEEDRKTLEFQITERGSNFERAVVYVNGIQVDEKKLVEGEKTEGVTLVDDSTEGYYKYHVEFSVPLNFGTNRVEVKAYNAYNIPQSFPAFEIQRKIPENKELAKPDLYILSVGINNYKNNKLTYSVPDAKAMAEALEQGKEGIYHHVFTKLLVDAKRQEIADALADIEKKARPQDVVLIYFSGHGMNAFTTEGKKLFYFVPQDFRWPDDPENENVARMQGIDADYLDETFTKIKSHKLILILDACHSGSVNAALASRGQDKEKATRRAMEKMANGTGRFIFASSSGNEESREHKDVGHGLYTYVLLNALGKNKDRNIADADSIHKDGYIYLSEIRSYMEQQFEEQTAKYLKGVIQSPPSMSLGRNGMHERVNDFPLLKVK